MRFLALFLSALIAVSGVFSQSCGPAQCYNGCTDARPLVDFVFLFDVSGSMDDNRQAVVDGLTAWAQSLDSNAINYAFAIVKFADSYNGDPQLWMQMTTSFSTFKKSLNQISINGGWESGMETLQMTMNVATRNLDNPVQFRAGQVKRVIMIMTDEDSDAAVNVANRYQSKFDLNACRNIATDPKPHEYSSTDWLDWQREIDDTAHYLIQGGYYLYLMNSNYDSDSTTCLTFYQYSNPNLAVQNADFTNFDAAATKAKLLADVKTPKNLQSQLLQAGSLSRGFDVNAIDNPDFIKNFFLAVTSDISKCNTTCYDYPCAGTKCQSPINMCDCKGVRNGGAVVDCNGVCGGTATLDCAGVCGGNNVYDSCGVCSAPGGHSQLCQKDCHGNYYLTALPTVAYTLDCPSWLNPAGYMAANAALQSTAAQNQWTQADVCSQFKKTGEFNNVNQCTFDSAYYLSQNGITLANGQTAEQNYLASGMAHGLSVRCVAGSLARIAPWKLDACGQCPTDGIYADDPQCFKDCNGNMIGAGQNSTAWFTDNCGKCVAPGSDPNGNKDFCNVCFGKNATLNECGQCASATIPGPGVFDGCGQLVCKNLTCTKDCAGVQTPQGQSPANIIDVCGFCVPASPGRSPHCVQDCSGAFYNNSASPNGPYSYDKCGNCFVTGENKPGCVQDCFGTWGGDGHYDACNQCVSSAQPGFHCLSDCNGTNYLSNVVPPHAIDYCGICAAQGSLNATLDKCGKCTNEPGYNSTAECLLGCDGVWRLKSIFETFYDLCNVCITPANLGNKNAGIDVCGVCPGQPNYNDTTKIHVDTRGVTCPCQVFPTHCYDNSTSCTDCPIAPPQCAGPTPGPRDNCGHCPGDLMYGKVDDCGFCCTGKIVNGKSDCNVDKDDCGVCFGNNINKDKCGRCNNAPGYVAADCQLDCLGNPYLPNGAHAVVDCQGICNGNSVCNTQVCGDGKVTGTELCDTADPATQNGCNSDCTVASGNQTGTIVGAVIGALAAVALLGLAAFLAVRYAVKNGLLGKAKQQVDFGASNTNPIYANSTKVVANPIYAA